MTRKTLATMIAVALTSSLCTVAMVCLLAPRPTIVVQENSIESPTTIAHTSKVSVAAGGIEEAADHAVQAVVFVRALHVERPTIWQPRDYSYTTGSGILLSPDGYILTNHHVAQGSDHVRITLHDHSEYEARLIGHDDILDLSLLKIEAENLPYFDQLSTSVRLGQGVLAVGNPFKLQSTVTAGIVSSCRRYFDGGRGDNMTSIPYIQTDAMVNSGNSGGALVDAQGGLVGMVSSIVSESGLYEGYSFALPADILWKAYVDLKSYGHLQAAHIGVNRKENTEHQDPAGVYVSVDDNSPASYSGLTSGSRVDSLDGIQINRYEDWEGILLSKSPGDTVRVVAQTDGVLNSYDIVLSEKKK